MTGVALIFRTDGEKTKKWSVDKGEKKELRIKREPEIKNNGKLNVFTSR